MLACKLIINTTRTLCKLLKLSSSPACLSSRSHHSRSLLGQGFFFFFGLKSLLLIKEIFVYWCKTSHDQIYFILQVLLVYNKDNHQGFLWSFKKKTKKNMILQVCTKDFHEIEDLYHFGSCIIQADIHCGLLAKQTKNTDDSTCMSNKMVYRISWSVC